MLNKTKFAIYNMKLAGNLMMLGFVLLGINKDIKGSGRNVFFFNDSVDLQTAIKEYLKK